MAQFPLPSSVGSLRVYTGAVPAGGAEIADVLGTAGVGTAGKSWYLISVTVSLVQGATQTPQPILQVTDPAGTVIFEGFGSSAAQAVSTTCRYTWANGLITTGQIGATTNVHSTGGLVDSFVIRPGTKINTVTVGIGANTAYAAAAYYVCELG